MKLASLRALTLATMISSIACAQTTKKAPSPKLIDGQPGSKLTYLTDANGDRLIDFSYVGYRAGESAIPPVPSTISVKPRPGDNTEYLQAAIDHVASYRADQFGFRGAVQLAPGTFEISGQLKINVSGVVLRGSGQETILKAASTDRRPLILIKGAADRSLATPQLVTDNYVPVNSMSIQVARGSDFKTGDTIAIRRITNAAWIEKMNMDDFGGERHGPSWKPGSRDTEWDRVVTKVDGNTVSFDAPITCAIDSKFGGGSVAKYTWAGRISNSAVENLRCESTFDQKNPKDEDHAWYAVSIENASDCWVRRITATGFAGSAVAVWENAKRITVEDCKSLNPVAEDGGWRRNAFYTNGQQVLFIRCYSEDARHDFGVGFCAAGPNAFVNCESVRSLAESGAIDSWSTGTLFDNVRIDGKEISLRNREFRGKGQGWSAANSVLWVCNAAVIDCPQPPGAQNYAIGTWGEFNGDGYWSNSDDSAPYDSLYYAQRADRLNKRDAKMPNLAASGSRAPTIDSAAASIKEAYQTRQTIGEFIDEIVKSDPIPLDNNLLEFSPSSLNPAMPTPQPKTFAITSGWLTVDGAINNGNTTASPWWNGSLLEPAGHDAITRFVPGRTGDGRTDDIDDLVESSINKGRAAYIQHPPLWYERRRDDHERIQRADGDVVAPFYEWPFARSGQGRAFDGLSKWDLTKPNPFYYSRLKQFADKSAPHGIMLITMHYMQHSILEAGGHYADYPWRSANNINEMKLPEPPNYAGDKLIYIGEQFYDVSVPSRAALHKQYIRTQLDQFKDSPNVLHLTSDEFTGDLRFTQFWIDTIAEWEKETGKHPLIGLYAPKDVTDAILADGKRSATVDLIYNYYDQGEAGFWYQPDGSLFAPKGGLNLSPRQHIRFYKPKSPGFEQVYKMTREYRTQYPDKAFIYRGDPNQAWAALMGGASMPSLNQNLDSHFKQALTRTHPIDLKGTSMALGNDGKDYILWSGNQSSITLDLPKGNYAVHALNPRTGEATSLGETPGGENTKLPAASFSPCVIWVNGK